ncbi:MAG: polysaccharide pyruvyl transferase family protein [Desulfamplus sp.]|nr:polysaccharide pyruvyl transferase family protein [Desulfamplus sp.]
MNKCPTKILFVGNGPNSNRGCEAIIRGTKEILEKTFNNIECTNIYNVMNNNESYRSDIEDTINHKALPISYKSFSDRIIKTASLRYATLIWDELCLKQILPDIRNSDIVLSVGGDNYSLDYGIPRRFIQLGKFVKKQGKPFVIFGASVGPFDNAGRYKKTIINHLSKEVDQIHVREKLSFDYLVAHGCRNVFLTADPAFLMPTLRPEGLELNENYLTSAIGLNLSPLIMKRIKTDGLDPNSWVRQMVLHIRDQIKRPVVLIYHVTSSHTDDYELLANIKNSLGNDTNDIHLLKEGMSAPELKWVISKLSCFIGSRTHSTIASLSSCVPTVSIAYSLKAWGINEELFGHTEYVLSSENMTIDNLIKTTMKALHEHSIIKSTLSNKMEAVKSKALEAGNHLLSLLSK